MLWPTPMHIVAMPNSTCRLPRTCSSISGRTSSEQLSHAAGPWSRDSNHELVATSREIPPGWAAVLLRRQAERLIIAAGDRPTPQLPNSSVTVVAHYKTTDHAFTATTDGGGHASITFSIGGPTPGYTVNVDVTVGAAHGSTGFTPQ